MSTLLGWAGAIRTREMTESKSVALPLGYSPILEKYEVRITSGLVFRVWGG